MITYIIFFLIKWLVIFSIFLLCVIFLLLVVPVSLRIGATTKEAEGKIVLGTISWLFGLVKASFNITSQGNIGWDISLAGYRMLSGGEAER